jgi:hypothetical protein
MIEVKQMVVKSTVLQKLGTKEDDNGPDLDLEEIKEYILAECRQLFIELLRGNRER